MNNKIIIIAEAGVNHNGKIGNAKKLIKMAADAGADFVKFQVFKTENQVTRNAPKAKYQILNTKNKENQYEMIKKYELSNEQFKVLFKYCKKKRIKFLASCFDAESAKNYLNIGGNVFKIPSGEINNLNLLEFIGKKNKKIFLSTGLSTESDIKDALKILIKNGSKKKNISIMQCTTDYPCKINDVNLLVIPMLIKKFNMKVGFSDHTLGYESAIAASAMGAVVIEKHITLNKKMPGPDHKASLNPKEFKEYVSLIRNVEKALGKSKKQPTKNELKNLKLVRKSIVAKTIIRKGEKFNLKNIIAKRPAGGISPMEINNIIGKKAKRFFKVDDKISL
jgi:N,N'-diacetyllegionaminate synthase